MSARFFLDTNIFVYAFDETAPKKAIISTQIIREALTSGKGCVSFQVVQEFYNFAWKKFTDPFTLGEAESYFQTIFLPLLNIHSSQGLYLAALRLRDKHKLAWYDSLIVAAAMEADCSVLYSEDLQHGRKFDDLQIKNPYLSN